VLGESADWLKDDNDKSIREYRLALVDAYRTAWNEPENEALHETLRRATVPLFIALRHNNLYPDEYLLNPSEEGPTRALADPQNARKDFDRLLNVMVANKFGAGETRCITSSDSRSSSTANFRSSTKMQASTSRVAVRENRGGTGEPGRPPCPARH
jgi:hypothetical protein